MEVTTRLSQKIEQFFAQRTSTKESAHRLTVFLVGIFSGLLGFPLHIIGVWGSSAMPLQVMSIACWTGLAVVLLLYLYKRIELSPAFVAYSIVMQTCLSAKIIYIACTMPPGGSYLILFNSFISLLVIVLLVMGYMHIMPIVVTVASLVTAILARLINPAAVQAQFILFFLFVEILAFIIGWMMYHDFHDMEKENTKFRNEERSILQAFHIDRQELLAYLTLSHSGNDTTTVDNIFDHLDERAEHNIVKAVKLRETEKKMRTADIAAAFPMLSPTELEVCHLVMRGKSLNEIARLLDKSANNISSVRIHIRKKLDLQKGQDLKEYLESKVFRQKGH